MKNALRAPQQHQEFHRDGSLLAKGQMLDDLPEGYWEWYRKDGTKMRSGHFRLGKQVGEWTTYARDGRIVRVTHFKPEI